MVTKTVRAIGCFFVAAAVHAHASPAVALGFSDAASVELFGNYLTTAASFLSPRVELRVGGVEASVGWRSIICLGPVPDTHGGRVDAEISLAPDLGTYNPAIGIGYLYIRLVPIGPYPDADASTLYFVLMPLRFCFRVTPWIQLLVSSLEVRYGPLIAFEAPLWANQGAFHLDACLFRLGIRTELLHGR